MGGFTFYFSSSLLSDFLSLRFPIHTRSSTHGILIASSSILAPHLPSSPPPTTQSTGDGSDSTALIRAAVFGRVECVKALVAADPDPAHLNMKVSIPRRVCRWCIRDG